MSFRVDKKAVEQLYADLELTASPDEYPEWDVMECVNDYLYAAYFLSINPLTGIRKILPQYKWTFHRLNSFKSASEVVKQSDFIWCTNAFGGSIDREDEIELVTATLIESREPLKLFYAGQKNASLGDNPTPQIKLAQDCSGEPMYSIITNR